jgi:acyl-CoA thioester hydrolase
MEKNAIKSLMYPLSKFDYINYSAIRLHTKRIAKPNMHPLLDNQALIYTHKITWGEMDAFSHVNNTEYFRFFEHARMQHFETIGMLEHMQQHNQGPILGETRCRFKVPIAYPDIIHIGVRVENLNDDRFTHVYTIVSENHNAIAAEGDGKLIYYDYNINQKCSLPEQLKKLLSA